VKRRLRISKETMEQRHAMQRARERYDLVYDAELRARLLNMIRTGQSLGSKRQSHRVTLHDLELDGVLVRVAYDRKRGEIVTFLTPPK
jgi:hypothetical protein